MKISKFLHYEHPKHKIFEFSQYKEDIHELDIIVCGPLIITIVYCVSSLLAIAKYG